MKEIFGQPKEKEILQESPTEQVVENISQLASQLEQAGVLREDSVLAQAVAGHSLSGQIIDPKFIETCVEDIASGIPGIIENAAPESKTLLTKFGHFLRNKGRVLTLVVGLEVLTASTAFAKKFNPSSAKEVETLRGKPHVNPPKFEKTENAVRYEIDDVALVGKHNIHAPKSLTDLGKMFIEPISFAISVPYKKEGLMGPVAKFLFKNPELKQDEDFIVDVDIPYKYAANFNKATPEDQKKMEQEMIKNAEELFDRILPSVVGPSFFKKDIMGQIGTTEKGKVNISEVKIVGYASPESDAGIGTNDARNQQLSKLRAENAAYALRNVFADYGLRVDFITYQGGGEFPLHGEEKERIEDMAKIELDVQGTPKDEKILELIKRYNDGKIVDEDIEAELQTIIGNKRKVALHLELGERRGVVVVPVPILLYALFQLSQRLLGGGRRRREQEGR